MKTSILLAAGFLLPACQSNATPTPSAGPPAVINEPAPTIEKAVLIGQVLHPNGQPLQGVSVSVHTGFATRFRIGSTSTDAQGNYRFELDPKLSSSTSDRGTPEIYLGVCVGSVRNVNPPQVLPWRDLKVENAPGSVARLDFEFDPESVPEQYRD